MNRFLTILSVLVFGFLITVILFVGRPVSQIPTNDVYMPTVMAGVTVTLTPFQPGVETEVGQTADITIVEDILAPQPVYNATSMPEQVLQAQDVVIQPVLQLEMVTQEVITTSTVVPTVTSTIILEVAEQRTEVPAQQFYMTTTPTVTNYVFVPSQRLLDENPDAYKPIEDLGEISTTIDTDLMWDVIHTKPFSKIVEIKKWENVKACLGNEEHAATLALADEVSVKQQADRTHEDIYLSAMVVSKNFETIGILFPSNGFVKVKEDVVTSKLFELFDDSNGPLKACIGPNDRPILYGPGLVDYALWLEGFITNE